METGDCVDVLEVKGELTTSPTTYQDYQSCYQEFFWYSTQVTLGGCVSSKIEDYSTHEHMVEWVVLTCCC